MVIQRSFEYPQQGDLVSTDYEWLLTKVYKGVLNYTTVLLYFRMTEERVVSNEVFILLVAETAANSYT